MINTWTWYKGKRTGKKLKLYYVSVAPKVSVHSMGAVALGGHTNILSTCGKRMGLYTRSPHHLVVGSQLLWKVCLGQCSTLQLKENLGLGFSWELPMPSLPAAGGGSTSVIWGGVELGGIYLYALHCKWLIRIPQYFLTPYYISLGLGFCPFKLMRTVPLLCIVSASQIECGGRQMS